LSGYSSPGSSIGRITSPNAAPAKTEAPAKATATEEAPQTESAATPATAGSDDNLDDFLDGLDI
jgi:hypothetical protein